MAAVRHEKRVKFASWNVAKCRNGIFRRLDHSHDDVSLNFGVGAFEFDGDFESGDGIDGAAEDVGFSVAVDVASGLLDLKDLRLALKVVEQKDAGVFGKTEAGGDERQTQ